MAERTGLEPATPCVTGRYSNQLNYHSASWWAKRGSNPRPSACKADALPTELFAQNVTFKTSTTPQGFREEVAEWTGLEPATPCVTGRYSNQLNYHSTLCLERLTFNALALTSYLSRPFRFEDSPQNGVRILLAFPVLSNGYRKYFLNAEYSPDSPGIPAKTEYRFTSCHLTGHDKAGTLCSFRSPGQRYPNP